MNIHSANRKSGRYARHYYEGKEMRRLMRLIAQIMDGIIKAFKPVTQTTLDAMRAMADLILSFAGMFSEENVRELAEALGGLNGGGVGEIPAAVEGV